MRQKKCSLSLVVGLLITSLCAGQQLSQRLTNQDVIDMVALGLSDELVVEKIHAIDSTDFDTSVNGLKALKAGKVSDLVIRAMITPHPVAAIGSRPVPITVGRDKDQFPEEVGVYIMRNGQLTQMEPEIVGWKTGGVMKQYATLGFDKQHINGKVMKPRSSVQLSTPIEFFIKTPEGTSATEYQLLHLYEKGNRREFRALTGGVYHASGGAERTAIGFTPEKVRSRTWRIRLTSLESGEYGFLPPGVAASSIAASGKIYAFGVEGEGLTRTCTNSHLEIEWRIIVVLSNHPLGHHCRERLRQQEVCQSLRWQKCEKLYGDNNACFGLIRKVEPRLCIIN